MWDSSCYPEATPIPYKEEDLWRGEPHWTKRYYGNSAKVMMEMTMAFATQFPQMTCINLISPEVYGPNSGFNPRRNKTIQRATKWAKLLSNHGCQNTSLQALFLNTQTKNEIILHLFIAKRLD